ncbi:hypothetical protein T07_7928 [Trichinella nelsoni]|uniref:Peptidase aspartic putative domain-containing protein n=1 Tax=Trichinella nelsoni TaxID=6336 RepID=A0A0V0RFX8_9BILA|nr:hypothetical protein T07_1680 [Trichinella nelsoni]KRX13311.1 hypothetical protein T07_7928 [Trichinella nelsoni]
MALILPCLCDDIVGTLTPWFCKDDIPLLQLSELTSGRVQIHVIIGLDAYCQVLSQVVRRGVPGDPVSMETIFGWIVYGPNMRQTVDREESAEETKPIPAIYDEEASAVSAEPSTSGYFPLFRQVRAATYGHRTKRFPKLPNHRRDLQILVPFRTTKAGDNFLLWQSASRHILDFATGYNIRLLAASRTWGMDGTFKIVPQ